MTWMDNYHEYLLIGSLLLGGNGIWKILSQSGSDICNLSDNWLEHWGSINLSGILFSLAFNDSVSDGLYLFDNAGNGSDIKFWGHGNQNSDGWVVS